MRVLGIAAFLCAASAACGGKVTVDVDGIGGAGGGVATSSPTSSGTSNPTSTSSTGTSSTTTSTSSAPGPSSGTAVATSTGPSNCQGVRCAADSNGTCFCKGICFGIGVTSQCSPSVDGTISCSCTYDNGTGSGCEGWVGNACDLESTCCVLLGD